MNALSASGLADLAGTTAAEVQRLVDLGILVARDSTDPFLETDVQKVRLAAACQRAGLPMEAIASAIRAGRLSFAFLEAAPFRRWAMRSRRTYRQVSQETGVPLELLGAVLESMGFARMGPDEPMREDELEVVPLLQHGFSSGIFDLASLTRVGRAHVEGLRLIATAWGEAYQARFEGPVLASGGDQRTAMERAAQLGVDFLPLVDPALLAIYRRQQELLWTEGLVERIEDDLEAAGALRRSGRVPAMFFLDLAGYTRLTEEQGDQAAAETALTFSRLVQRTAHERRGRVVKWLGDGVMLHFGEPSDAIVGALEMAERVPAAGLPQAHVGVDAGPVIIQDGDYFGSTVNVAARIAGYARTGEVLASERAMAAANDLPAWILTTEVGPVDLKGVSKPVVLRKLERDASG